MLVCSGKSYILNLSTEDPLLLTMCGPHMLASYQPLLLTMCGPHMLASYQGYGFE